LSLIILAKYRCFGKNNDGSIKSKQVVQHYGKGSNAKRQEATRSYGSFFPDRKFVLFNDLGNDKVYSEYNPNSASTVLKVTVLLLRQEVVQGI
jgi:6-phosphogluconolactonase